LPERSERSETSKASQLLRFSERWITVSAPAEILVAPRPVTNVSMPSISPQPLSAEMRAQHGSRLVVGLESLAQEPRQRKEAMDGAGVVHIGRLHPGIDQPVGIGAALVAQRIVARGQHEGGR